jgi:alanyl-tRNA synthetase
MKQISGELLFKLKATHGLPLDMALDRIIEHKVSVEWPSFIEAARADGWPDWKTYYALKYGLQDAFMPQSVKQAILDGFATYVGPQVDLWKICE